MMRFELKLTPVFTRLLTVSLLIFPQTQTIAQEPALRDIAIADLASTSGDADLAEAGKTITESLFTKLAF